VIRIPEDAEPYQAHPLTAGLYDPSSAAALEPTTADGEPVFPVVGRVIVHGPARGTDPLYTLGEGIGLASASANRSEHGIDVCLEWVSLAPAAADYQVFVHVLGLENGAPIQADTAPRGGRYPTSVWRPGEVIPDCIPLAGSLPEDGWQVAVGMYDLATLARLPVRDAAGQAVASDMVLISP
jgi:hypothetical protein